MLWLCSVDGNSNARRSSFRNCDFYNLLFLTIPLKIFFSLSTFFCSVLLTQWILWIKKGFSVLNLISCERENALLGFLYFESVSSVLKHGNKERKHKDLKTLSSKGETFMGRCDCHSGTFWKVACWGEMDWILLEVSARSKVPQLFGQHVLALTNRSKVFINCVKRQVKACFHGNF